MVAMHRQTGGSYRTLRPWHVRYLFSSCDVGLSARAWAKCIFIPCDSLIGYVFHMVSAADCHVVTYMHLWAPLRLEQVFCLRRAWACAVPRPSSDSTTRHATSSSECGLILVVNLGTALP